MHLFIQHFKIQDDYWPCTTYPIVVTSSFYFPPPSSWLIVVSLTIPLRASSPLHDLPVYMRSMRKIPHSLEYHGLAVLCALTVFPSHRLFTSEDFPCPVDISLRPMRRTGSLRFTYLNGRRACPHPGWVGLACFFFHSCWCLGCYPFTQLSSYFFLLFFCNCDNSFSYGIVPSTSPLLPPHPPLGPSLFLFIVSCQWRVLAVFSIKANYLLLSVYCLLSFFFLWLLVILGSVGFFFTCFLGTRSFFLSPSSLAQLFFFLLLSMGCGPSFRVLTDSFLSMFQFLCFQSQVYQLQCFCCFCFNPPHALPLLPYFLVLFCGCVCIGTWWTLVLEIIRVFFPLSGCSFRPLATS